ncbi:MAG: energy-coupling factor ABC transporter permease [Treponema sp.]|jgi:cobalt/nickel transport system permease protein|nr:energy-coupling factor ABC transporter permease [Treponema sp.]
MHMADALVSPVVGGVMWAVSAGAVAYSMASVKKASAEQETVENGGGLAGTVSLMAIAGAFVFAAQMINFTIPGTGSSGHIGGGILLACLLGSSPALLAITSVLAVQALFFADGGLLALGCNIFNMGIIPCLFVYPLVVKPLFQKWCAERRGGTFKRFTPGCVLGVMIALPLGAFFVTLETLASGITVLPFSAFVLLMLPIHLAIAAGEAAVTALVIGFVAVNSPEVIESAVSNAGVSKTGAFKRVVAVLGICALVTGGLLSLFASSNPDGLEWSIEKITGSTDVEAEGAAFERAAALQDAVAFMPDYDYREVGEEGSETGTIAAGIAGSLITCALAGALGAALYLLKRNKPKSA